MELSTKLLLAGKVEWDKKNKAIMKKKWKTDQWDEAHGDSLIENVSSVSIKSDQRFWLTLIKTNLWTTNPQLLAHAHDGE